MPNHIHGIVEICDRADMESAPTINEIVQTFKRELEEELGIDPSRLDFHETDRIKEQLNNGGVISNEFVRIFVIYSDINLEDIKLQEEEVSEANWFTYDELKNLIDIGNILPHVREYEILESILNRQCNFIDER